jgi:hypothetical protein
MCVFLGLCSGVAEASIFIGCDAASLDDRIPTFREDAKAHFKGSYCPRRIFGLFGAMKMRTLRCPETSGFDYPVEQHRIAEEWRPQKMYSCLLNINLTLIRIKFKNVVHLLIFCVLVNIRIYVVHKPHRCYTGGPCG